MFKIILKIAATSIFSPVLTLGLALASSSAFAARIPESPWVPVYELTEKASSQKTFIFLQKKYPDFFRGYDPKSIVSAEVSSYVYEYQDVHTCAPDDSRLRFVATNYGLCRGSSGYAETCFQSASQVPSSNDPCGK